MMQAFGRETTTEHDNACMDSNFLPGRHVDRESHCASSSILHERPKYRRMARKRLRFTTKHEGDPLASLRKIAHEELPGSMPLVAKMEGTVDAEGPFNSSLQLDKEKHAYLQKIKHSQQRLYQRPLRSPTDTNRSGFEDDIPMPDLSKDYQCGRSVEKAPLPSNESTPDPPVLDRIDSLLSTTPQIPSVDNSDMPSSKAPLYTPGSETSNTELLPMPESENKPVSFLKSGQDMDCPSNDLNTKCKEKYSSLGGGEEHCHAVKDSNFIWLRCSETALSFSGREDPSRGVKEPTASDSIGLTKGYNETPSSFSGGKELSIGVKEPTASDSTGLTQGYHETASHFSGDEELFSQVKGLKDSESIGLTKGCPENASTSSGEKGHSCEVNELTGSESIVITNGCPETASKSIDEKELKDFESIGLTKGYHETPSSFSSEEELPSSVKETTASVSIGLTKRYHETASPFSGGEELFSLVKELKDSESVGLTRGCPETASTSSGEKGLPCAVKGLTVSNSIGLNKECTETSLSSGGDEDLSNVGNELTDSESIGLNKESTDETASSFSDAEDTSYAVKVVADSDSIGLTNECTDPTSSIRGEKKIPHAIKELKDSSYSIGLNKLCPETASSSSDVEGTYIAISQEELPLSLKELTDSDSDFKEGSQYEGNDSIVPLKEYNNTKDRDIPNATGESLEDANHEGVDNPLDSIANEGEEPSEPEIDASRGKEKSTEQKQLFEQSAKPSETEMDARRERESVSNANVFLHSGCLDNGYESTGESDNQGQVAIPDSGPSDVRNDPLASPSGKSGGDSHHLGIGLDVCSPTTTPRETYEMFAAPTSNGKFNGRGRIIGGPVLSIENTSAEFRKMKLDEMLKCQPQDTGGIDCYQGVLVEQDWCTQIKKSRRMRPSTRDKEAPFGLSRATRKTPKRKQSSCAINRMADPSLMPGRKSLTFADDGDIGNAISFSSGEDSQDSGIGDMRYHIYQRDIKKEQGVDGETCNMGYVSLDFIRTEDDFVDRSIRPWSNYALSCNIHPTSIPDFERSDSGLQRDCPGILGKRNSKSLRFQSEFASESTPSSPLGLPEKSSDYQFMLECSRAFLKANAGGDAPSREEPPRPSPQVQAEVHCALQIIMGDSYSPFIADAAEALAVYGAEILKDPAIRLDFVNFCEQLLYMQSLDDLTPHMLGSGDYALHHYPAFDQGHFQHGFHEYPPQWYPSEVALYFDGQAYVPIGIGADHGGNLSLILPDAHPDCCGLSDSVPVYTTPDIQAFRV